LACRLLDNVPGTTMLPSPSRLRPIDETFPALPARDLRLVPRESRVAVVLNANAKRVNRRVLSEVERILPRGDVYYSETLEQAKAFARAIIDQRYTTVLVGGGDGTVTSLMNHLVEAAAGPFSVRPLPDIGVLRLGTGNGLGNLTRAGKPIHDVLRVVGGDRPPAQPLRLVEDVPSGWIFPFASLGYDARVLNDYIDVVDHTTSRFGRWLAKSLPGYFYALGTRTIPGELEQKRAHMRVVALGRASIIDPETKEEIPLENGATLFDGIARSVAVGTSPFYGFGMRILPYARRRSDRFHVRVSTAPISYLLSHLPSLWAGTLTKYFHDFLVEGVRVDSTERLPLQMAGDARGLVDRLELRLSSRAFRLIEGTSAAA
jgi:diacylglycerol kinase family enzyme